MAGNVPMLGADGRRVFATSYEHAERLVRAHLAKRLPGRKAYLLLPRKRPPAQDAAGMNAR